MPSPNLPQLSPRAGNGLGGIPRKSESSPAPTVMVIIVPATNQANQSYQVPDGYKKARVSFIGRGGLGYDSGSGYYGGNGGGCSISDIFNLIPGKTIDLLDGGINQTLSYASAFTIFMPYASSVSQPSRPTGGVKNFAGGKGSFAGSSISYAGGGAATLFGDGQNAAGADSGYNGPTVFEGRGQANNYPGKGFGFGAKMTSDASGGQGGNRGDAAIYLELWP